MQTPGFGGALVTFPHKLHIDMFLQGESESARSVGAMNTVVVGVWRDGERVFWEENTGWVGVKSCIEAG